MRFPMPGMSAKFEAVERLGTRPTSSSRTSRQSRPDNGARFRSRDTGRGRGTQRDYEQQRKEYEQKQERKAEERKQQFDRERKEHEAERARREKLHKARVSKFDRILDNAPAMFNATQ
jgi:hypothetical protein